MADGMGFDEVLAICLDALDGGQGIAELLSRYPEHAEELEPLLEAAAWFGGQAPALEPRPGFIAASRKRLEQQIAAPPVASADGWLQRTFGSLGRGWRVALQAAVVVVMLACVVMGSSGIAYASQNALPGDALYPVKLGLEQVELWVTLDPQENIRLHIQLSQLRLAEMERLLALGRYDDLAIAAANYQYHISQALALLRALAAQNPVAAKALALELSVGLTAQADTLSVLVNIAPQAAQAELEAVERAAREGAQEAQEIGQQAEIPPPTDAPGGAQEPTATETPTAPPTVVSFAISTPTPTSTPSPTPSPTLPPTQTQTPTPTKTPTRTPARTTAATARPSSTPTLKASRTPGPTATKTPQPTPTRIGQPTPTRTIPPTATRTGQPTPTRTIPPTATRTGQPTPTRTLPPTPTRTVQPSPTATQPPVTPTATDIPTSTIAPTPTRTPRPTHTPRPTETPEPSPYPGPGAYPPPHQPFY